MRNLTYYSVLFCLSVLCSLHTSAQQVELVTTTKDSPWRKKSAFKKYSITNVDAHEKLIALDTLSPKQKISGFGGCFNEFGWGALQSLSSNQRDEIFKELFSTQSAHFNYNRFPIGSSDYAFNYYSLADIPDDFSLSNFSIARDKMCLIPYIQKALAVNPQMHLFASPWCPPYWMKTNNHYACRPHPRYNGMDSTQWVINPGTTFKMQKGYLDCYARYLHKAITAFAHEGVTIHDLHVQNEVGAAQIFPSCLWRPQDIALFISDYLGPLFEKTNCATNIYLGTLNVADPQYVVQAMETKNAAKYIAGFGFQWAGKKAIRKVGLTYPGLHLVQTENECGNGSNDWRAARHTWSLLLHYLDAGAEAYTYWNMVLPKGGVSQWGWRQNSMITVDTEKHTYAYHPEYYLMKHFSHYVETGASMMYSNKADGLIIFQNPDSSIVCIFDNNSDKDNTRHFQLDKTVYAVSSPAHSFSTLVIKP